MCRILLALVLLFGVKVSAEYEVPVPLIEVLEPKGLRISIPDAPGISKFSFHANVNNEMQNVEMGEISLETYTPVNGRWTVEKKQIRLNLGDVLNYWIFVSKDQLGYRSSNREFVVEDTVHRGNGNSHRPRYNRGHGHRHQQHESERATKPPCPELPTISTADSDVAADLDVCQSALVNMSQTILRLQAQIEALTANIEMISNTIDTDSAGHKIILSGMIPPNENAREITRFIILEKLDLESNVTVAVKRSDGSIEFEVPTIEEKIAILEAAATKLTNSRIMFTSAN